MLHNQNRAHLCSDTPSAPRSIPRAPVGKEGEKNDHSIIVKNMNSALFKKKKPKNKPTAARKAVREGWGCDSSPSASVSHSIISRLLCNRGTDSWEESHGSVVKLTGKSDPLCFSFTVSLTLSVSLYLLSKPCVSLFWGLGGTQGPRGSKGENGYVGYAGEPGPHNPYVYGCVWLAQVAN